MIVIKNRLFQLLICLLVNIGVAGSAHAAMTVNHNHLNVAMISDSSLDSMRNLKILFGHQSIGMNTITGVADLAAQNSRYRLVINEVSSSADFGSPKLGHFRISSNKNPLGKISEFNEKIRNTYGTVVDVAFFKLCPFDIDCSTDIISLFNTYKKTMASLKSSYPNITFVHITCPLVDSEDLANVRRNQFNKLLLKEYTGKEYIFDIAVIEATHQNGAWAKFTFEGQAYHKLCSEYRITQDRVHLNNIGKQRVAKGMIYLLATIAAEKK